jgi:hypothetical protein
VGREDPEVAEAVRAIFQDDNIDVILGAEAQSESARPKGCSITNGFFRWKSAESHLYVAECDREACL